MSSPAIVASHASAALEGQRAELARKCWTPAAGDGADPATAKFVFNFTFDPAGRQVARGMSEVRGTSRPEVTACVSRTLLPLVIRPPGLTTYVEVPFSLP